MKEAPVLFATQQDTTGELRVRVNSEIADLPIEDARIEIFDADNPNNILYEGRTDANGLAEPFELPTPPLEYSMEPNENQPYATYSVRVTKEGYDNQLISGAQVLPTVRGEQNVSLLPNEQSIVEGESIVKQGCCAGVCCGT